METKGKVSAVSFKDGKHGIQINGQWYNGFGEPNCKKGDDVTIEYKENGDWKNTEKVTVNSSAVEEKGNAIKQMSELKNKTMCRVSAITNATNLAIANKTDDSIKTVAVIEMAKELLKFMEE